MNFSHKFVFPGALKSLLLLMASILLPLSFLAGCRQKAVLAADQPVAVRLRAPNHLQEPVSVAASGSVEATLTALTAFQVGGRAGSGKFSSDRTIAEYARDIWGTERCPIP